jgi:hypothetical protein
MSGCVYSDRVIAEYGSWLMVWGEWRRAGVPVLLSAIKIKMLVLSPQELLVFIILSPDLDVDLAQLQQF